MIREEEIHKIANTISTNIGKEIDEDYICNDEYDFTIGFECGVKWADEHPKEELVSVDKVCEWWEQHVADYDLYDIWNKDYVSFKSLIMDFREAMEDKL